MLKHKAKKRLVVHVKTVLSKLAKDLGIGPCDLRYVLQRLHSEGLTFVTKILPLFSKFAIKCCDEQRVLPRKFLTNFCWEGRAPRFMRGLLEKAVSGCPVALRSIRQFCDYFYKTAFGFTESQLESAERKYVSVDLELEDTYHVLASDRPRQFIERARKALVSIFPVASRITPDQLMLQARPHDGPGSFAGSRRVRAETGLRPELFKKTQGVLIGHYERGQRAFSGFFRSYPGSRHERISCRTFTADTLFTRYTASVSFVPKDSRGPRVISSEPYFRMKAQLSFNDGISYWIHKESGGRINFGDQTINQELAKRASTDRSFATIDLKDASDRISLALVGKLFQNTSALRFFSARFRSTHVTLPSGRVHRLRKFANMGSGMCFPVLSLVVYLAAVTAMSSVGYLPLKEASKLAYVYGDDLIVPTQYVALVTEGLEMLGLLVNEDKSFSKGFFRESCGGDFYHGIDVAPVRLKIPGESLGPVANYRNSFVPISTDRGILQLERHLRELMDAGLYSTAGYLYKQLNKLVPLPSVSRESNVLGVYDPLGLSGITPDKLCGGYVPMPRVATSADLCPYKLMAPILKNGSQGTDPYLIPLRYEVVLKKKQDIELVSRHPYGLPGRPYEVINLASAKRFAS